MKFITIENFENFESKLSIGGIYSATKPFPYQKIPLYYEYPSGKGPVILRTPDLFSLGVFENNSLGTNELTGYSMSFLGFNEKNGKSKEERKFMEVTERISKFLREQVIKMTPLFKKGERTKKMNTEDLTIFKNKSEDLNSAPLFFGKLFTKKNEKNIDNV